MNLSFQMLWENNFATISLIGVGLKWAPHIQNTSWLENRKKIKGTSHSLKSKGALKGACQVPDGLDRPNSIQSHITLRE
jgi:hypothetical protein